MDGLKERSINIIIVEDNALARNILEKMVLAYPGVKFCNSFDNAEDCLAYLGEYSADVVLMDMGLPNMSGVDASKLIKQSNPNIKIILFFPNNQDLEIFAALDAKVNAYLIKDMTQEKLFKVISAVLDGGIWIDSRIQHLIFNLIKSLPDKDFVYMNKILNPIELRLINMVLKGFNKAEISRLLNIDIPDLSCYVYSIFTKLAKAKSVELVLKEIRYDML